MTQLGYQASFVRILGVWKVLGGIGVLAPGLSRLKEWANAVLVFDLTGAAASYAAVCDPVAKAITLLIITLIVLASWYLRTASHTL